jgi:nucleotide-binding universal stress UspA family protein
MTRGGKPGPVVVGVDRAGSANDAVDWATAEAAARDCSLRIAHVFRSPLATDAYGLAMPIDSVTRTHTAAQLVLQAAVARARSVAPDSEVSARLLTGATARVLLDQARDAQLLVLGGRGRSGVHAPLAGSITSRVVRHSPCPVVVIHPVGIESMQLRAISGHEAQNALPQNQEAPPSVDLFAHIPSSKGVATHPFRLASRWAQRTTATANRSPPCAGSACGRMR